MIVPTTRYVIKVEAKQTILRSIAKGLLKKAAVSLLAVVLSMAASKARASDFNSKLSTYAKETTATIYEEGNYKEIKIETSGTKDKFDVVVKNLATEAFITLTIIPGTKTKITEKASGEIDWKTRLWADALKTSWEDSAKEFAK